MDPRVISGPFSRSDPARLGTRFRVYPQPPYLPGYEQPETIWISTPPGQIAAGPSDPRMYVIDPVAAKEPYAFPILPPYGGHWLFCSQARPSRG